MVKGDGLADAVESILYQRRCRHYGELCRSTSSRPHVVP